MPSIVVDMVLEIVRRFEANHPESLKAAYVINGNFFWIRQ